MGHLPLFIDVQNKPCLVVGAGSIATRKLSMLVESGAKVTVLAPNSTEKVSKMSNEGKIEYLQRIFKDEDIKGQFLIVAATDDTNLNIHIADIAKNNGIFVNVANDSSAGNTLLPSVVDRAPMKIAISTGGASPVLARLVRNKLESFIPSAYGNLAHLIKDFREIVKEKFSSVDQRRKFWESVLQGPVAEMIFSGQEEAARKLLREKIKDSKLQDGVGEVYLVGAGPGDPDLLSFRALRLMQQADVVVYDRLVSEPILKLVRLDAERIYAGKERAEHALPQDSINSLLINLAKKGNRVLRLKGGDPFIFGRGGEEIETLIDENIPFQIVPGITAASGCASYAGIPLTHRDFAQACIFATGHLKDGTVKLNWKMLANEKQTLVFYMGLIGCQTICEKLIQYGLSSATPAAIIVQGTTSNQKVYLGDLATLPGIVADNNVQPPTLIIIGEVVKLHKKLRWFHSESNNEGVSVKTYASFFTKKID
jgi:uroporphyrin-III C-methyltransferase/precorrin-2 dehydrogenase/sirohydrochlorin ferrochelatase